MQWVDFPVVGHFVLLFTGEMVYVGCYQSVCSFCLYNEVARAVILCNV